MESFSIRSNKRKCEKSCKSIIMESKENIWNKCVDDQIDRSQSYKECESGFFNIRETNRCKIDLCSLCCIKGENVFNRENTEKCKLSCTTKYKDY